MRLSKGHSVFHRSSGGSRRSVLLKTGLAVLAAAVAIAIGATVQDDTSAVPVRPALSVDVGVVPPIGFGAGPLTSPPRSSATTSWRRSERYLRTTLGTISFIRNDGQWDDSVLWIGRSLTGNVLVERDGLRLVTPQDAQDQAGKTTGQATHVWALKFENSPWDRGDRSAALGDHQVQLLPRRPQRFERPRRRRAAAQGRLSRHRPAPR